MRLPRQSQPIDPEKLGLLPRGECAGPVYRPGDFAKLVARSLGSLPFCSPKRGMAGFACRPAGFARF